LAVVQIEKFMATYVYETIPQKKGQQPRQFEVEQSMKEAALTHDPKTGEPVRRVITGGSGWITHGSSILMKSKGR
jgi:predicted nucleic acid-binding Zn ribbon protein